MYLWRVGLAEADMAKESAIIGIGLVETATKMWKVTRSVL